MIIKLVGNKPTLILNFEYNIPNDDLKIGFLGLYSTNLITNFVEKSEHLNQFTIPPGEYNMDSLKKFKCSNYEEATIVSPNEVSKQKKINPIETINIHCNLADGMIVCNNNMHTETNIISTFKLTSTEFKQIINYEPRNPIYFPLQHKSFNKIEIKICDQNDNLIDFGGVDITVVLEIK